MDPFGSHTLRALITLLSPPSLSSTSQSTTTSRDAASRSKKSQAFKARQGSMKSVLDSDTTTNGGAGSERRVPERLRVMALKIVEVLSGRLSENEIRALASDKVASPALQVRLLRLRWFISFLGRGANAEVLRVGLVIVDAPSRSGRRTRGCWWVVDGSRTHGHDYFTRYVQLSSPLPFSILTSSPQTTQPPPLHPGKTTSKPSSETQHPRTSSKPS